MKSMTRFSLFVYLLATACGDATGGKAPAGSSATAENQFALYFATKDELPDCDASYDHVLVYLEDEKTFKTCDGRSWKNVDIGSKTASISTREISPGATCTNGGVEVTTQNGSSVICNGVDGKAGAGSTAFDVVAAYNAIGNGANFCTEYAPNESCYFQEARIDVFGNGTWQVRIVFNHLYVANGDIDTQDKDIAFLMPNAESGGGFYKLVDRFVFRTGVDGTWLFALVTDAKDKIIFIHDTNGNYILEATDTIIGEYALSKEP